MCIVVYSRFQFVERSDSIIYRHSRRDERAALSLHVEAGLPCSGKAGTSLGLKQLAGFGAERFEQA